MVRDGQLDLAASVMNETAEMVRTLANKYDLEIVAPSDMEGLVARDKWLRLGRIPAGYYDIAKPIPATDKLVAQVDTLVMTNACVHRAERVAFLMLLSEEFPNFVRVNPPPSAKSQDSAPLADEAREFFASGEPELADKYFPWLVNLMSPAYWIYLVMAATVLLNGAGAYSRFRLWRIDANRALLGVPAEGARLSRSDRGANQGAGAFRHHARADQGAATRDRRPDAEGQRGRGNAQEGVRCASPALRGSAELLCHADGLGDVLPIPGVADRRSERRACGPASLTEAMTAPQRRRD